jgi:hypothetical protein
MGSNLSLFKTPGCNPASNPLSSCDLDTDTDKNCIQSVHTKMECMIGMDSLPFPDEIVLKILGYLSLGELIQCARVSKMLNVICEDKSLSYISNMLVMQGLTVKGRKSIIDALIANPELTEVNISPKSLEWGIEA